MKQRQQNSLESIRTRLPFSANFNPDLDTFINVLCTTLIVDAELKDIAVSDLERPALRIGSAETDMVQKSARTALGIADEKLGALCDPDFGMDTGDDF